MAQQAELFNDNSEFFSLFQKQNKYSEGILEKAKQIKQDIQKIYNNETLSSDSHVGGNDTWVFDFDVSLTQVSEQSKPDDLKLFTRRYTPFLNVYKNNILQKTIEFNEDTRFIHKHINELFVGVNVSQEYFFDVARQSFLLDFVDKQIENERIIDDCVTKVVEFCPDYGEAQQTIICINCKLRGREVPNMKVSPDFLSAINQINKVWKKLSEQSGFIVIGNYSYFLYEDEFISQLNGSKFISETISNYFPNDFLLLNNMEFIYEKSDTRGWSEQIFSPLLLEKIDEHYKLKDIEKIKELKKEIFLFQKIKLDGEFHKTDIYIPDKYMNQDNFNRVVSLSKELLRLKNTTREGRYYDRG